jgi:periplasmic copper chaperone A
MLRKIIAMFAVLFATMTVTGCSTPTPTKAPPEQTGIIIEDVWVRASEYSAKAGGMTGVFAKITNRGDKTITLIGGITDAAKMVQTHEVVDGTMQEKKGGIEIHVGQTVTLQPGGLHIMLMNLTSPIVVGDKIDFTFKFDKADPQTFTLTAKESAGGDETYNK